MLSSQSLLDNCKQPSLSRTPLHVPMVEVEVDVDVVDVATHVSHNTGHNAWSLARTRSSPALQNDAGTLHKSGGSSCPLHGPRDDSVAEDVDVDEDVVVLVELVVLVRVLLLLVVLVLVEVVVTTLGKMITDGT